MKTIIVVLCFMAGLAHEVCAVDQTTAVRNAKVFLRKFHTDIAEAELNSLRVQAFGLAPEEKTRKRWEISSPRGVVSIDFDSGRVNYFGDMSLMSLANHGPGSDRVPGRGKSRFGSIGDVVGAARSIFDRIGWEVGSVTTVRPDFQPDEHGDIPRRIVYAVFTEKPFGIPTGGGNTALAGFDSLSGELVEMSRTEGFTYAPPQIVVSKAQAAAIATQILSVEVSPEQVVGPVYQELSASFDLTDRGRSIAQSKRLVPTYLARTPASQLFLAADDGAPLARKDGGVAGANSRAVSRKTALRLRTSAKSERYTLLWTVPVATVATIALLCYFWKRNRSL